jgi:hypothetical protein
VPASTLGLLATDEHPTIIGIARHPRAWLPGFAWMPATGSAGKGSGVSEGVSELLSPCGAWRFTVRRLARTPDSVDGLGVLARVEPGGIVAVFAGAPAGEPGIGGWKPAGPGRVVVVVEWFVRDAARLTIGRVSVRGAAALSADGRTCQARLRWRYLDPAGRALGEAVAGEADGTRLEP